MFTELVNSFNIDNIISLVLTIFCALISITVHEFSHGYAAYRLGDDTAKIYGRLSLNPLKHLDIYGVVCLILFKFGWAKPVPVNFYNFKNKKSGVILVSLAGPFSNLILAFLSRILLYIFVTFGIFKSVMPVYVFLSSMTYLNLGLCVFNLIPIPPLDGSKILASFLKGGAYYRFLSISNYSSIILMLLFFIPGLRNVFSSFLMFFEIGLLNLFDLIIGFVIGVF